MFILRCTQKLLKRLHLKVGDLRDLEFTEPTTALGDWYAHLLIIQRQHLVMFVSDSSRLCVLTTAKEVDRLSHRFTLTLRQLLHDMEIPEVHIEQELREVGSMRYGLTTGTSSGRSVLGTINDFTHALSHQDLGERSLFEINLHFSNWLCGPLNYERPRDVTKRLLANSEARDRDSSSQ